MGARAGVCAVRQHCVVTLEHLGALVSSLSGIARLHHQPRRPCGRWWLDDGQVPWPHPQHHAVQPGGADASLNGILMQKQEAQERVCVRFLIARSPSGCAPVQHDALSAGCAIAGIYGRRQQAGPQCCELPCYPGFAGIWRRNRLPANKPESCECLTDAYRSVSADCTLPAERWEALLHVGGVEPDPPLHTHTHARARLPLLHLPSQACLLRLRGCAGMRFELGSGEASLARLPRAVATLHSQAPGGCREGGGGTRAGLPAAVAGSRAARALCSTC